MSIGKIVSTWFCVLTGTIALAGFSTSGWSEEANDCPTEDASNFGGEDIGFGRARNRNETSESEADCARAEPLRGNTDTRRRVESRDTRDDSNEPMANTGDTEIIAGRHSRMSAGIRPGIQDESEITTTPGSPMADYKDAPENDEDPEEGSDPDNDSDSDEDNDNDTDG